MKPIMSFWSVPYINQLHNKWINENSWNLSWLLSVASITKLYGKPHLYTDTPGAKFLVNTLGLEFANVDTSLDDIANKDPRFFSLGRIVAMSMQSDPFLHIDYDSYLFEKIPDELFKNGVLFHRAISLTLDMSMPERVSKLYRPDLFTQVKMLPDYWKDNVSKVKTQAYQSCIVGGSNLDFFKEYTQTILDIVNSNDKSVWDSIENEAKLVQKGEQFVSQYTLDGCTASALAKKNNIQPKFIVNEYNIDMIKFGHIGTEKQRYSDAYGRILRRLVSDFPEKMPQIKKLTSNLNTTIPKITVIVISKDANESIYDSVLRAIVPRRISPDEVIVPDFNINENDKILLNKLDGVKFIAGGSSYIEALNNAYKKSNGQLIIVMDGNVKLPKLYIEKSIAANLEYPECVFAMASTGFANNKNVICYSSKDLKTKEDKILDMPEVFELMGGVYIFPKNILEKVLREDKKPNDIKEISYMLVSKKEQMRCIKGLIVSNDFKTNIEQ